MSNNYNLVGFIKAALPFAVISLHKWKNRLRVTSNDRDFAPRIRIISHPVLEGYEITQSRAGSTDSSKHFKIPPSPRFEPKVVPQRTFRTVDPHFRVLSHERKNFLNVYPETRKTLS